MSKKIKLNTEIYAPVPFYEGGDKNCEHDFPEKPDRDEDEYATWKCTKCGMKVTFEVYQ